LSSEEVDWVLSRRSDIEHPTFVQGTFADIYFTDEENCWIDQTITNIQYFNNPYKKEYWKWKQRGKGRRIKK
jgi:hypothetical protein